MSSDQTPLPERVANYYSQLSAAAKDLNSISDELGKSIAEIDIALKKLNLGVVVWVSIREDQGVPDLHESWYWSEDIGYAKIGANWGICLRKVTVDYRSPAEEAVDSWLFNEAPRALRISAIEKIPDLLQKLSAEALKTTDALRARLGEAKAVAEAVKAAADRPQLRFRSPSSASSIAMATKSTEAVKVSASNSPSDPSAPVAATAEAARTAICAALTTAGLQSASVLLGAGVWAFDGASLRIEVTGMGKKMISLTVNAAAEKIIRQELQRLGASSRFLVVPGEGNGAAALSGKDSAPISNSDTGENGLTGVER